MNAFQELQEKVKAQRCETCSGTGWCDDAGDGDIWFNSWTCPTCKGKGLKESNEHQS